MRERRGKGHADARPATPAVALAPAHTMRRGRGVFGPENPKGDRDAQHPHRRNRRDHVRRDHAHPGRGARLPDGACQHRPSPSVPEGERSMSYAAEIARALATPGGHLSIGRGGFTLHYGNARLSGYDCETIKAE